MVEIEDLLITDFSQQGILDGRAIAGAKLFIRNSVIRNNTGNGISVGSTGGANATIIDNVHSINNTFGIETTTGNNVSIARSVFSGNTTGVEANAGATMNIDGTLINHNTTGVQAVSGNIRVSSSSVSNNSTGFSGSATTFGNNRFIGNSSLGTAPTATALQ